MVEHDGETWVFAELYDRVLRRGVIGCCQLTEHGASSWKIVLNMPYHLSYPHIMQGEDAFYMIPESYVANEIGVFKAVEFPYKWEKCAVLKNDFCAVDSTVFELDGKQWMLTLRFCEGHEELTLFSLDEKGSVGGTVVAADDLNKRPAGKPFTQDGKLIRPAQDCTESYGCALNFYEVTEVSENRYEERLVRKIRPEEIRSDLKNTPAGLHTYNMSDSYEVVDLKEYELDWLFYIMRPIWFVWRRVRKVFGR